MPGRVARGGQTTTSRTSARISSPVTAIPDEGDPTSLRKAICTVFSDAQRSTAGHRKLVISLRKIQEACCYEPVATKKSSKQQQQQQADDFDEDVFNAEVVRCVLRVLQVKKAEAVGDRVVRFLGTYLSSASAKDVAIANEADPDATSLPETPTSRLTSHVLNTLLPLLGAKDKVIRFRATQITSHIINSLDTLDDVLFHQLRLALLKRIHDKEAMVRLQAVYGLGRLAAEVDDEDKQDDSDSDNDAGNGVLEKLLNVLQNDPAAEVRRNLLLNLPLTKEVLPYLLERARDADGATRKALYARLLPALGDFRHLSLTHREKLLRWGLRDRDENVRKATARLFCERWIEDCAALPAEQAAEQEDGEANQQPANQAAAPSLDALLELLERIDVVNSGTEGGIALTAMKMFWEGRPDYVDYVSFPDDFWDGLSPELAFVVRTFNDYCRTGAPADHVGSRNLEALVEEKLPEVTKFGFFFEREMNKLVETMRAAAMGDDEEAETDSAQCEFIVEQLLHLALTLDYSDEVGRRKMFGLMREALALPDLPEESTRLVVEVLRLVCGEDAKGEREFCGVVLEAIAEVHDTIMGDGDEDVDSSSVEESFHSATSFIEGDEAKEAKSSKAKSKSKKKADAEEDDENPEAAEEKAIREIMVNMKCLHIALCMLQNVACDLEENVHLVTMLNNLVVPAVRSQEAPIRERGLLCLGLCCLLAKNLAEENLTLFLHCFAKGHAALQTIALQIIADILLTHPSLLAPPSDVEMNPLLTQLTTALKKSLKSADPSVQATGATALSKLLLARLFPATSTDELLKALTLAYFDPDTASNFVLRQALSYFLPVYCHSRTENARCMARIAAPVLAKLVVLRETLQDEADVEGEDGSEGMVKLGTVVQMLVEWTDPRKGIGFAEATAGAAVEDKGKGDVHFLLADAVLERLNTSQIGKEERKLLVGLLGKLHLPAGGAGVEVLGSVLEGLTEAQEGRVVADATGRNVLSRMYEGLLKMMGAMAAAERGGGGMEETGVVDTTEAVGVTGAGAEATEATEGNIMDDFTDADGEEGGDGGDSDATVQGAPAPTTISAHEEEGETTTTMTKLPSRTRKSAAVDTTLGATTTFAGQVDAEGTRVGLGVLDDGGEVGSSSVETSGDGDTEMTDV